MADSLKQILFAVSVKVSHNGELPRAATGKADDRSWRKLMECPIAIAQRHLHLEPQCIRDLTSDVLLAIAVEIPYHGTDNSVSIERTRLRRRRKCPVPIAQK
jgi:hypothetical protein